ncbi:MAG TPA: hypothetical protein VD794_02385, partial [Flavisolibacter sp.]|nr:hypothetical protein [Flavisolibacter sp.]
MAFVKDSENKGMKDSKNEYPEDESIIFVFEENKPVQYLTIWDFLLTPVYLIVLTAIAKGMRDKRYPFGHPLREYYLKGLYVKFAGAIFIALVYQYYYGGGDTFNFFRHAQIINSSFSDSVSVWFKLITRQPFEENPDLYPYISRMYWYDDPASYLVATITAILGLFTGTTYIPTALLLAFFTYTGIWAMYRTFANIYPSIYKPLAIAFLFIPSTFVWGSAIFKDTVCMFGLGWLTYTVFRIFISKDFSFKNISLLSISFLLLLKIKIYILLAFLPALGIWLLTTYSSHIPSAALRTATWIFFIGLALGAFYMMAGVFAEELNKYSLDKIAQTAAVTRGWINYASGDEGSAYDLGAFDPSIVGMLTKFPQAVVVTLFRPFPWEARKVIVLLSAVEALAFLYFSFKAFSKGGIKASFTMIVKDANLFFCLVFSLIFAFAVGITSYNFG